MTKKAAQMDGKWLLVLCAFLGIILFSGWVAPTTGANAGQAVKPVEPTPTPAPDTGVAGATPLPGAPVTVNGQTILYVYERLGSITPIERAKLISEHLNALASDPFAPPVEIILVESSQGTDLVAGEQVLLTITDGDAAAMGMDREQTAQKTADLLHAVLEATRQQNTPTAWLVRLAVALGIIIGMFLIFWLVNRSFHRLEERIDANLMNSEIRAAWFKANIYQATRWKRVILLVLNLLRRTILALLVLVGLPVLLEAFPATTQLSRRLFLLTTTPLSVFWNWLVNFQQEFFTITIIILVTYLLVRLTRFIFSEIEAGTIRLEGFEPDWAPFTNRIVAFLLVVGASIVAFPYIPGSDSAAFQGITIFLGALFTLSSTAAVSNIVAGVIQTYTGAFRVGDVIRISETTGIVIEKRLLTTRVRNFKNEEVIIPNGLVLNNNIVNYSKMARQDGLILYTTITIGYDAPWRQVHELLTAAALDTPDILSDPPPFILQTSLNDYHISYQLNCYTHTPERMAKLYSALHQNVQDRFNQAGVEILSPAYEALRDGNTLAIPQENRPQGYEPPGFRVR